VRVVYRADQQTNDVLELYSAPIDGSAPAVKLNGALAAGGDVQAEFRISADGTRVLYRADQTTTGITELFCAPIDGSQPAVALTPGQGLSFPLWYEFSPDGGSVVYVDDRDTPGVRELYRVASTGGATVKLSGALVAGGNVTAWTSYVRPFSISADSSRVAFLADQNADEVFELFGAPLDGSASAVRLSPPLGGARDVMSFLVSPDSARVVFLADRTDERFELFSAPLDGSAAALKLNGTLPTGGDVAGWADGEPSFRITPRGTRVVYRADELVNNRQDLFAVPTDGSAPSVRLNGAVPAGDIGPWFELMPDGRDVVYLAGGLFSAPLDGAGPQHTLHGPGQTPYEGTAFRFDLAARQVVYRARESGSNVNELFLSFVPRPHRSSGTPDGDATRSAGF
jgi:Tol biopolymer transport system component